MSAQALTQNGYGDATRAMGTPRDLEYQVFSQVTGRLNRANRDGQSFSELANALHENMRLWIAIASDITGPGNGLPLALRVQLADLSKFMHSHTQKVLRREADAAVLIEINTAIMRGLRGQLPSNEA